MRKILVPTFLLLAALAAVSPDPLHAADARVSRGEYLVHHVAMCVQCHSPRDERGGLILERALQGGRIPVPAPQYPGMAWALKPPRLAGLPGGYSEEDLIRLLTRGEKPRGGSPRPPMPPFRMQREDAEAIAAYLKSLDGR
jgi:mono/diheme cytochrome c family protein